VSQAQAWIVQMQEMKTPVQYIWFSHADSQKFQRATEMIQRANEVKLTWMNESIKDIHLGTNCIIEGELSRVNATRLAMISANQKMHSHSAELESKQIIDKVHVFVDHSNIRIGSADFHHTNVDSFLNLITNTDIPHQHQIDTRIIAGSNKAELQMWAHKMEPMYIPREQGEKGVDEFLHAQMLKIQAYSEHKYQNNIIVIVTGDGNDNEGRTNFPKTIKACANQPHISKVIIWSWKDSCSKELKDLRNYKNKVSLWYLDKYRPWITSSTISHICKYDATKSCKHFPDCWGKHVQQTEPCKSNSSKT
jgi:hypothetical protein